MKTHQELAAAQRFRPGALTINWLSALGTPVIQACVAPKGAQSGTTGGQPFALIRKSQEATTSADELRATHATARTSCGKVAALKRVTVASLRGLVQSSVGQRCHVTVVALDARQQLGAIVKIDADEYPPGSLLPAECDFAEHLGVGRISERKAEIAFAARERPELRRGPVACVRKASADVANIFPEASAFDLTTASAVLESEAAALAAGRVSGNELAASDRPTAKMCDRGALTEAAREAVRMFHLAIARITGHPVISRAPSVSRDAMRRHFLRLFGPLLEAGACEALA